MGQPVDANGRSILHKGHAMTHTAAPPDACKTPSPGGPVPIPYVNVAMDSNITDGAESVKIEGNPVANVGAKISTSMGDEPGTAGGILSSKFKGTVTWKMGSLDVKAEGKSVVRFLDTGFHNGNSFNTSFIAQGGTGAAYGDDFSGPCPICQELPARHRILETPSTAKICSDIVRDLRNEFRSAARNQKKDFAKLNTDRRTGRVYFGGYMVGVMICRLHKKKFAAMSGGFILDGFRRVASRHGCTVVGGGGAVTAQNLCDANTAGAQPPPPASRLSVVQGLFTRTTQRFNQGKVLGPNNPYSVPGMCAGAHLIAKSGGHGPLYMTEMYFSPRGNWQKMYVWRVEGIRMPNRLFGENVHAFTPWGNTVASCHSCQDLLYLALCPEVTCK